MKFLSEREALKRLGKIKSAYRSFIRENYEHKAKNCLTCETQGACCLDEHFVNVRITRLESAAIFDVLQDFDEKEQVKIFQKVEDVIEKYDLNEAEPLKTFACPLFEKGIGCLIHSVKPVPCIQHACYERSEDLPPDELQTEVEIKIERLNQQTYAKNVGTFSLPIWLKKMKNSD